MGDRFDPISFLSFELFASFFGNMRGVAPEAI